jgi:hypothetical protein
MNVVAKSSMLWTCYSKGVWGKMLSVLNLLFNEYGSVVAKWLVMWQSDQLCELVHWNNKFTSLIILPPHFLGITSSQHWSLCHHTPISIGITSSQHWSLWHHTHIFIGITSSHHWSLCHHTPIFIGITWECGGRVTSVVNLLFQGSVVAIWSVMWTCYSNEYGSMVAKCSVFWTCFCSEYECGGKVINVVKALWNCLPK